MLILLTLQDNFSSIYSSLKFRFYKCEQSFVLSRFWDSQGTTTTTCVQIVIFLTTCSGSGDLKTDISVDIWTKICLRSLHFYIHSVGETWKNKTVWASILSPSITVQLLAQLLKTLKKSIRRVVRIFPGATPITAHHFYLHRSPSAFIIRSFTQQTMVSYGLSWRTG